LYAAGDNNAVVPAKLQSLKVFDVIGNFQPIIHLRKGFGNDMQVTHLIVSI